MSRRWVVFLSMSAVLLAGATWSASELSARRAAVHLGQEAEAAVDLRAALLRTEIERYRALPYVLARDPDVSSALASHDPIKFVELSQKLSLLSAGTHVNIAYVQDTQATIVSSNKWLLPNTFVNCRCGNEYYFDLARRTGSAEYFAKGRGAKRGGLYITQSVQSPAGWLGVTAIKVEFNRLEQEWQAPMEPAFVTDANGVVLITSIPEWRYKTLGALPAGVRVRLTAAGQFAGEALGPLPVTGLQAGKPVVRSVARLPGAGRGEAFTVASAPLGELGWTLHLMKAETRSLQSAALGGGVIAFLSTLLIVLVTGLLLRRHEVAQARALQQAAAREELEARVEARTAELSAANAALLTEIDNRRLMQDDLHRLHDDLVQANKLATLGQIAAGVAHEINQPLAAIRTYAENSAVLLKRGRHDLADENLSVIGKLTGRIAVITDELRAFARRATGETASVSVTEAIDGALLLVSHRFNRPGMTLVRRGERPELKVRAEQVRLEQVLVNLLQNALDALEQAEDGRIEITVETLADQVRITVADNGPGLSPKMSKSLFMPFATTKPQGLGLGLVISRDIVTELGGDLTSHACDKGAAFVVTLAKAA